MANGYANRLNADPVDGTPVYPAQAERHFLALGLMPDSGALRARAGRRLGAGLELAVAGDGLSATVQPGTCVVPAPDSVSGPYAVAIPTAVTLTLPARPASGMQRRDRVVVRVYDEEIAALGTTLRESRVELVTGTAASSPTAPALPTMAYEVGQLNSTSAATTVYSTNLARTWSAGGIGVVASQAERDALNAYNGLKVYREDVNRFESRITGAWQIDNEDTGYVLVNASGGAWSQHATRPVRVRRIGKNVILDGGWTRWATSGYAGGVWTAFGVVPADMRPPNAVQGTVSAQAGERGHVRVDTAGNVELFAEASTGGFSANRDIFFNLTWYVA